MTQPERKSREERFRDRLRQVEDVNSTPAERALSRRLRGEAKPKELAEMTVAEMREYLADRRR